MKEISYKRLHFQICSKVQVLLMSYSSAQHSVEAITVYVAIESVRLSIYYPVIVTCKYTDLASSLT